MDKHWPSHSLASIKITHTNNNSLIISSVLFIYHIIYDLTKRKRKETKRKSKTSEANNENDDNNTHAHHHYARNQVI